MICDDWFELNFPNHPEINEDDSDIDIDDFCDEYDFEDYPDSRE